MVGVYMCVRLYYCILSVAPASLNMSGVSLNIPGVNPSRLAQALLAKGLGCGEDPLAVRKGSQLNGDFTIAFLE